MPRQVVLYSKADCPLCVDARADLDLLALESDFELIQTDIAADPVLHQRLRYLVPAVDIDGGELLTPPLSLRRLRDALSQQGTT